MNMGIDKKYVMRTYLLGNPFLKTPDEVIQLFGFNASARAKLKFLSRYANVPLKISDRSLDNLSGQGISIQKADRVLEPLFLKIESEFDFKRDNYIGDTIGWFDVLSIWRFTLASVEAGIKGSGGNASFLNPLASFIERRCNEYEPQQQFYVKYRGRKQEEVLSHIDEFYMPIIDKILLNEAQKATLLIVLEQLSKKEAINFDDDTRIVLATLLHDFNLSLFAALELTVFELINLQSKEVVLMESILEEILATEGKAYFGKLINYLKLKSKISFRKISECIPVTHSKSESGNTNLDTQKSQLKEWRSGKSKPSFTRMVDFFDNFPSAELLIVYGQICIAIDLIIKECELEIDIDTIRRIYTAENYSRYFNKEKQATT